MKKIKLALLALPLLVSCGSSNSNTFDTGWVYLKEHERVDIYLNEKTVISRENNRYYSNVCYRYTIDVIDLKYDAEDISYHNTYYGSNFSLVFTSY